jgi:hypothetical protein
VISQSKKSEETSLHQLALTFNNNGLWYEKTGTARQFVLAQPNVVHNMEHIWVIHAGQIVT